MDQKQVEDLLLKTGIYIGRPADRRQTAMVLSGHPEFTPDVMEELVRYVKRSRSLDNGFIVKRLENGDWLAFYHDMKRAEMLRAGEKQLEAGVEYATPDNPYGRPPNRLLPAYRSWDHDTPSIWNAYRHSYNGPNGEKTQTCTIVGFEGAVLAPSGGLLEPRIDALEPWRVGPGKTVQRVHEALDVLTKKMSLSKTDWSW